MQDFIERHVTEPITLHMLAKEAGYSPWYAARIFKELTGKTPFEYIREFRLSRAAGSISIFLLFEHEEAFDNGFRPVGADQAARFGMLGPVQLEQRHGGPL